jgi:uracil-DNA glycosylase family 4
MFTGDRSGDWLFAALFRAGLAAQPTSVSVGDGQHLGHVRITATVHCAPPANKPTRDEERACADWLDDEVALIATDVRAIVSLGGIAWTATQRALVRAGWQVPKTAFGHGAEAAATTPDGAPVRVIGSYHPSQQNTFTGRLTEPMLDAVFERAAAAAGLR